jgi:hypothetical protein
MKKPQLSLKEAWEKWVSNMPPKQAQKLIDAGFNLDDINDDGLPMFHRRMETKQRDREDKMGYADKVLLSHAKRTKPEEADAPMDFAIYIAAQLIDAFDCSRDKSVRLHADCMRLAIGHPSCKSQDEVCKRYSLSKANISWRVRSIQKRFNLSRGCFNGNRFGK